MRKKIIRLALSAMLLALGFPAQAQQLPKVPQIGYVSGGPSVRENDLNFEALREGLRELGYVEGKNILIEYRSTEGKLDRAREFVAELVRLKVDVLASGILAAILAAKEATKTIPIVMVLPDAAGLVDSLARPGGNITGIAGLGRNLIRKRLELLQEVVPRISRVGVLWDANAPWPVMAVEEYATAARALKIRLQSLEIRGPDPDLEGAFRDAAKRRVSALIIIRSPLLNRHQKQKQIADLAIRNRLPSMTEGSDWVEAGGLISYAINRYELRKHAAVFIDKILKGAKPADLPVEQPTKFELVINLKTAKEIGVTIQPDLLVWADKIIK